MLVKVNLFVTIFGEVLQNLRKKKIYELTSKLDINFASAAEILVGTNVKIIFSGCNIHFLNLNPRPPAYETFALPQCHN